MLYQSDLVDIYESLVAIRKGLNFLGDPNNPGDEKYALIKVHIRDISRIIAKIDKELNSRKS